MLRTYYAWRNALSSVLSIHCFQEVLTVFDIARSQFPNALVRASTFENFTSLLMPLAPKLPVVTKEIGDVWIQGSGSDPRKTAQLRAMFRARSLCLQQGMELYYYFFINQRYYYMQCLRQFLQLYMSILYKSCK